MEFFFMSESSKNLLNINQLSDKVCNSNNFLNFKWDSYSVPVIDVDFFDLFSRLVIHQEVFKFDYELSKEEIEKLISSDKIHDRLELEKLDKTLLRTDKLEFEEYLSQNTLSIFKNPEFYINRLNEPALHTPLNNNDLNTNLNLIYLKNKKILNETGLPNLYLALGFYTSDEFNAPLVFIPVKLVKNGENLELSYDSHDEIRLNTPLELKLKEKNITLPKKTIKSETDMVSYLTAVNKLGDIKSHITLGLFDFTTIIAYNDLEKFSESTELNDLLKESDTKFLFNESEIDLIDENNSFNVLDADSSQISAIREALLSSKLFIDAPAGSNKLDTIVNLISEIIANKQTVLVVSDKINEIHGIEERLSDIGLEKAYINLYGNNYNYKSLIEEIRSDAENTPEFEFDKNYTSSKLNELNNLKGKLAEYSTFINTPYKKTGFTPYDLMGTIENEYSDELSEFEMKNLSNLTNKKYQQINQEFRELSDFYVNKIYPVQKHEFNYITAKDITDDQLNEIITSIPTLKSKLDELIKLNNEINTEFGVKKLSKLNDYQNHLKNLEVIENNPQLMGEDYNSLKEYADTLESFQAKINEYGTIEELEEILLVDVYNTHLDLENQMGELNKLNDELTKLNDLLEKFKIKISDAGIKNLKTINKAYAIEDSLDLLNKNPSIISDENKINSFVEDLIEYQKECGEETPSKLLMDINKYSKVALTSTLEKINNLIGYQKSIDYVNKYITDIDALKTEIGLNEFKSIKNIKDNLKKSDILLSHPVMVEDEQAIDEFIELFKVAKNKFGDNEYADVYSMMNESVSDIQNKISDEISKTRILETNIPTMENTITTISENINKLSNLLNIKKIDSLKEVDEYCDNIEILLKNPILIPSSDKPYINAHISLLEDIKNEEDYTKLNIDEVTDLIAETAVFNNEVKDLGFENSIFSLDLNQYSNSLNSLMEKLQASPIKSNLDPDDLNRMFTEFEKEHTKRFKFNLFGGNYKKLKEKLQDNYKLAGKFITDEEQIYQDYKKQVKIVNDIEDIKKEILKNSEFNDYMETEQFKEVLDKLIELQNDYNSLKSKYNDLLDKEDFDDALKTLIFINLKVVDINEMFGDTKSTLKFNKGINSNRDNINSKLKRYFPKSYFNLETDLNELYEEYIVNEDYRRLLENEFFSNDSLDKCNLNKDEIKTLLQDIKQSKDKIMYTLNSIGNNIEISKTSLDLISVYNKPFFDLKNYFYGLSNELSIANDLFNNIDENYKIDDIDKIIENYSKLNDQNFIKEFANTDTYQDTLVEYKDDFALLNKFNSISTEYSSIINKYFTTVWKDKSTSLKELNDLFESHKVFTKLVNDGFFSQNTFKFLENSDSEIKSKIIDLNNKSTELIKITTKFKEELTFYDINLDEITLEEYKNNNNEILKTIQLLKRYSSIYNCYDENKLIFFDEKPDLDSLDIVDQLSEDLTKLYIDPEVLKYHITFEIPMENLDKITENKTRFIELIQMRDSIENQDDLIQHHFDKIWAGADTKIPIINSKIKIDKSFTKLYNEGVFSDKTAELVKNDESLFKNYKQEFISLLTAIETQFNTIKSNPIISSEFKSEFKDMEFNAISKKTAEIQNDINKFNSNYNGVYSSNPFDLEKITLSIGFIDEIIQSKYIKYLNMDLDNLNNSNENLKTKLSNHNELQSLKDSLDSIPVDSKYFKDIDNGYETSVPDLNQKLKNNKTYEDLFNKGFFSNKTDETIKDRSKLNELKELTSQMEGHAKELINLFEIMDLIHSEKGIALNKSLDDSLNYVNFFDENINQLKDWVDFERKSKDLDSDITHEFIKALYKDEIKPDLINKTFTYNFARNLYNEIKDSQTFISDEDIDKYCELDSEVIELNKLRVLNEYVNSKPNIENIGDDAQSMKQYKAFNKFNDLNVNDNKTIKDIFDASIDYIKAIKPIFITTPASVFKYLSSCDFDYIIFNDVNQIKSEIAITTLLRADNKIVIGDSKQSDIGLISLIKNRFKTKSLKWRYNAKNTSFYNDKLIAYPKKDQEPSFEIITVDNSIYNSSSQINESEAAKIVDLAINHVNEHGFGKTLGIIAFTKAQGDYIIKLLIEKIEESPDLVPYFNPLDSFYVKYIDDAYESRDVILASLTYGLDADNVLNTEFTSENQYVINKLITKSFEKTIVLTNFKQKDIANDNSLKSLFKYQPNDGTKDFKTSLFEESVYNFLNDNDFTVKKQLVDFTINNDTSIECEGENFNKFESIRDKFRLHRELLERLGWKSLHICTSEWIENKSDYQNRILDSINADVKSDIEEDISLDDDFIFDFENEEELTINELKELL